MSYITTKVTASRHVAIKRECEFCGQQYSTPKIEVQAEGSQDSLTADTRDELKMFHFLSKFDKTAKREAQKKLDTAVSRKEQWLLSGSGRSSIGVLCPKCFRFSSACTQRFFPTGEKSFLLKRFYGYAYLGMWIKVVILACLSAIALSLLMSIPDWSGRIFSVLVMIFIASKSAGKFFSRFDQNISIFKYRKKLKRLNNISDKQADRLLKDAYIQSGHLEFGKSEIYDAVIDWVKSKSA